MNFVNITVTVVSYLSIADAVCQTQFQRFELFKLCTRLPTLLFFHIRLYRNAFWRVYYLSFGQNYHLSGRQNLRFRARAGVDKILPASAPTPTPAKTGTATNSNPCFDSHSAALLGTLFASSYLFCAMRFVKCCLTAQCGARRGFLCSGLISYKPTALSV